MIHAIRIGTHAEKDYLLRASPWFTEMVVNANLLEATAGATAILLVTLGKPYVIDPVTYAFAQDPFYLMSTSRDQPKRTFQALSERFGQRVATALEERRRLTPEDFADGGAAEQFCKLVLDYQETRVAEALAANEEFLDPETSGAVPPARLLTPYFYNDEERVWLGTNRDLVEMCAGLVGDAERLWVAVSFGSQLLDQREQMDALIEMYQPSKCGGFAVWPSDFDETRATVGQIVGVRRLVTGLGSGGRGVLTMYGGYFSALLKDEGMTGITHGVGYGEKRDIVPVVGGGLPPAKYYLRAIHDDIYVTILLRLASGMDADRFRDEICDCTICAGLLAAGGVDGLREEFGATETRAYGAGFRDLPTPRVYRLARFHYIDNKRRELEEIESGTRDSLIRSLRESYGNFRGRLDPGRLGYLLRWADGLSRDIP